MCVNVCMLVCVDVGEMFSSLPLRWLFHDCGSFYLPVLLYAQIKFE